MMAGLPGEALKKVITNSWDEDNEYWLCSAFEDSYGIPNFQSNPFKGRISYSIALSRLGIPDVIKILQALIGEKSNGQVQDCN